MSLLGKRYAHALHSLAQEQNAVDAIGSDLAAIHAALTAPGARALLASPDVKPEERSRILATLTKGRHQLVGNLVGVLQHRHRLDVLFDLHPEYRALVMAERGEVEGIAESAQPLTDADVQQLATLAGQLSGKKVQLTVALRPELLGGVRLRVGNVLYDGSLRQALEQLERRLQQAAI